MMPNLSLELCIEAPQIQWRTVHKERTTYQRHRGTKFVQKLQFDIPGAKCDLETGKKVY